MRGYGDNSWFTKDQGATYTRVDFGGLVEVGPLVESKPHRRRVGETEGVTTHRAHAPTHARADALTHARAHASTRRLSDAHTMAAERAHARTCGARQWLLPKPVFCIDMSLAHTAHSLAAAGQAQRQEPRVRAGH
jgi:hypothetical protein